MFRFLSTRNVTLGLLLGGSLAVSSAFAQKTKSQQPEQTWNQADMAKVVSEVRGKLANLSTYGVFDWITFGIQGKTLVLNGYASRPELKSDAENAVKHIDGVQKVQNNIQVLPLSTMDDRIRAQVYNRIYTQPALSKYNANQGSIAQAMGPGGAQFAMMSGGITNNPPIGYHAIHIIVNNGRVTLYGVVMSHSDSDIANIQANGTPGVFGVNDDLVVQGAKPGQAPD